MTGRVKPLGIVYRHIKSILPMVDREIDLWTRRAESIPEPALKTQALASLKSKRFHCDGGSVFATWLLPQSAKADVSNVVRLIVAFQTMCDYLDNLCDRTDSLSEEDFRRLHQSMFDAISSEPMQRQHDEDYYLFHPHQNDGGYLAGLVDACQIATSSIAGYRLIEDELRRLLALYVDLQVYKHIEPRLRVSKLKAWFADHKSSYPQLYWWEFAAASGSTLAMFVLIAHAANKASTEAPKTLVDVYFPWVCGVHILLDYLIDQAEDHAEGDLNFVSFYANEAQKHQRLRWILEESLQGVRHLSDRVFHTTVIEGLLGLYLSDPKVKAHGLQRLSRQMIRHAGWRAGVIFTVCRVWQRTKYSRSSRTPRASTASKG